MYSLQHLPTLALLSMGANAQGWVYPGASTDDNNQLSTVRDNDIVDAVFPDVDEIELLSPYFLSPETRAPGFVNGTQAPTDDLTMDFFIRSLASRNDWMSYQAATFLSDEGRPIPYVYLSEASVESGPMSSGNSTEKIKVYIQAVIHGNEPAADEAVFALLAKMDANQTWTASLLEKMDILILPRWNPDAVAAFQRRMASNLDANREAIKMDREQTRNIRKRFIEFSPHLAIDMHEYPGTWSFGEEGEWQHSSDALLGGGVNHNIHPDIREQVLDVFHPAMAERLESFGLRASLYVTGPQNTSNITLTQFGTDARFADTAMGLSQCIAFLFETRGIRLADQQFQRRVATQLVKLEATLETARDNDIYSIVENAREEFISSNDDIIVTDSQTAINTTFPFVNRNNGSIMDIPVTLFQSTALEPNLTRSRPEAYLIPRTYSEIAERLRILGLEVQTLDYEYRGTVEALNVTSSTINPQIFEGHILNTVETEAYTTEVRLPVGGYLVSTRQKNAALAFTTLEPENVDSYVTFGFVPLMVGDQYPIFRVMAE